MKIMPKNLRLLVVLPIFAAALAGCESMQTDRKADISSKHTEDKTIRKEEKPKHDTWLTDLDKAMSDAKASNKMLLVDFTATWCGPCQMYIRDVFPTEAFKNAAKDYILVSIDIDQQSSLAKKYEVNAVPDIRIFSPKGDQIEHLVGYYGEKLIEKMRSAQKRAGL